MTEKYRPVIWSDVYYECDKCHKGQMVGSDTLLLAHPPLLRHQCNVCGEVSGIRPITVDTGGDWDKPFKYPYLIRVAPPGYFNISIEHDSSKWPEDARNKYLRTIADVAKRVAVEIDKDSVKYVKEG